MNILRALAHRIDGLVDSEAQGVPVGEMPVARAWHDVERAVDCQRHHRQLQLIGKGERSLGELSHVTGEGARSLREHHHTVATLRKHAMCGLVSGTDAARATLVDKYLMTLAAGIANKRHLF